MYKIGELSKLCQLPVKTLRYYDNIGLLVPDEIDPFTGYRYYSAARLADCYRIVALKELGFSLEEIGRHLNADLQDDVVVLLDKKKAELIAHMQSTETQLRRIAAIREIMTEGEKKMFDIILRSSDLVSIACIRQIFKNKNDAYFTASKMENALPKQILGSRKVIINYETEYRKCDFDLAAGVEITAKLPKESEYQEKTICLPGEVASLVCQKEELECAYRYIAKYLADEKLQIVGAFYEFYHNDGTVELKIPIHRATRRVKNEEILPFVNDEKVLGKWKLLDIVPSEEQFLYGHQKRNHTGWLEELYFCENGERYWNLGGWTKGYLFTNRRGFDQSYRLNNQYTIKTQDGHTLLFLAMKSFIADDQQKLLAPEIWVYEKVDGSSYHPADIRRRDFVDHPFVLDEQVVGQWKVRDFYGYDFKSKYNPQIQNWNKENLFVESITFNPDGSAKRVQKNGTVHMEWTKGYTLEKQSELASSYEIREIDGTEYLIVDWKSGDYVFGAEPKVCKYVFMRG